MYGFERESRFPQGLKTLLTLVVCLAVLWFVGSWVLRLFGVGGSLERVASPLYTEGRGIISVSLQGENDQAAENGMNMFPGDVITVGPAAHASLQFFDGTWVRTDESTTLALDESSHGKEESRIDLGLKQGRVWAGVLPATAFTGAVVRRVVAPAFTAQLPAGTDAVVSEDGVVVYAADGEGVKISAKGAKDFFVGEGQKWTLPAGGIGDNPYATRSPLVPKDLETPFVLESRQRALAGQPPKAGSGTVITEVLTVTAPANGFVLHDALLTVRGTVSPAVAKVTVNGGDAVLDSATRAFSQEVTPPDGAASFDLVIKALDADGKTLASVTRSVTVQQAAPAPDAPTITSPAAAGQTYATDAAELLIRGTAPSGAEAIYVNEYKLQLFTPGKGSWSYLASQSLGNLKSGTNVYDVTAVDAQGKRSARARITIIVGQGEGGVVTPPAAGGTASSGAPRLDPSTLPTNDPLSPGTLSVTGPTPGTTHTETGTGFLLEGKTSADTATMWVNNYQLQLYTKGKTSWNYIASEQFGNLKRGQNVYRIISRNAEGKILDLMDYTVTFTPGR